MDLVEAEARHPLTSSLVEAEADLVEEGGGATLAEARSGERVGKRAAGVTRNRNVEREAGESRATHKSQSQVRRLMGYDHKREGFSRPCRLVWGDVGRLPGLPL